MSEDTRRIFVSYRRDESAGYAGRIADSLVERFGEDRVFRDIDSLEPGLDFVEGIERAVDSSEVLVAVIGKNWLTATDKAGQRRLESSDNYVRVEIATALRRNIRVIPLLVQGAAMPSASELPKDLAPLSRRNAFELHDASWRHDVHRLISILERIVGPKPNNEMAQPPPVGDRRAGSTGERGVGPHVTDPTDPQEYAPLESLQSWAKQPLVRAMLVVAGLIAIIVALSLLGLV
jgi:TIR domain